MKHRELPLTALRAFSVAAEWKSLSRAAVELGVTHGAISRHIGQLEKWLGTDVFVRQGRSMALTPAGERLAQQIGHSFGEILTACSDISVTGNKQIITVEAPATFAMYWLLPRLPLMEKELRNTDISLVTRLSTQRAEGPPADIVITRGPAHDARLKGFDERPLVKEEMGLVASPSFIAATGLETPEDVVRHVAVGSVTRPNDWPEWLDRVNLRDRPLRFRHMFDHLFIAMHCVLSGVGSIVAPVNIFNASPHAPQLVPVLPHIRFPGESYYLRLRARSPAKVNRLADLIAQSV